MSLCRKEHNVICLTDETPCDDCGKNLNSYPDGIIILSCKHVFHARCFMEEAQRPTCNVCREEIRFLLRTADDTMYGHHLASSDSDSEDAMRMRLIQDEMARLPSCIDCNPAWPHWYCYSCHSYTSRPTYAWRLVSQTNDVMFFSTERTFCLSVALEALRVKGVRALQLEDCFARFMQRF